MPDDIRNAIACLDDSFFSERPFEMVRSAEILPILEAKFRPIWQTKIRGILYPLKDNIEAAKH